MANVEFAIYALEKTEINKLPVQQGQLIFATDEKKVYLDISNDSRGRVAFDSIQFIRQLDKYSVSEANLYFITDTKTLEYYDGYSWTGMGITRTELETALNNKAPKVHNHDDLYYRKYEAAQSVHTHVKSQVTDLSYKKGSFTILPSEIVSNTDSYSGQYPWKKDVTFYESTNDYYPYVVNEPSCDEDFAVFARANAMNGIVRLYFREKPTNTLYINSIIIQKL